MTSACPRACPGNLQRLADEIKEPAENQAKKHPWGYPDYFFATGEAAPSKAESKKGNSKEKTP